MDFDFATSATLMVPIILVVFGVILIFSAVKVVPQGYQYTVEQFGRFTRVVVSRCVLELAARASPAG